LILDKNLRESLKIWRAGFGHLQIFTVWFADWRNFGGTGEVTFEKIG